MLQSGTAASSLQRIYEEGYLTCSTAVYYEGQGNEEEAMRCWKTAVQQIQNQHADGNIPEYAALTETEKALSDSLRELEYQAQERIDLLEALKESRQGDPFQDPPGSFPESSHSYSSGYNGNNGYSSGYGSYGDRPSQSSSSPNSGYIGGGTIPAITYSELSRPELSRQPPPVPPRISTSMSRTASYDPTRRSGELPASPAQPSGSGSGSGSNNWSSARPSVDLLTGTDADLNVDPSQPRHTLAKRSSRSPNKDRQHTLRPTLRAAPSETAPKSSRSSRTSRSSAPKSSTERQGASKAATLAWAALGLSAYGKSESSRKSAASSAETSTPKLQSTPSSSLQMPQTVNRRPLRDNSPSPQPALQWDSNSRRLVPQRSIPDPVNTSPSHSSADLISLANDDRRSGEYLKPQSLSLNAAASALGRSMQTPTEGSRPGRLNRSISNQRPSGANLGVVSDPLRPKSTGHARFPGSGGASALGNRIEIRRNVHSSYAANVAASNSSPSLERSSAPSSSATRKPAGRREKASTKPTHEVSHLLADVHLEPSSSEDSDKLDDNDKSGKDSEEDLLKMPWKKRKQAILKSLPPGVDDEAAKQILNEIVVQGDVVHWGDIAGLELAKKALREVVVYPFLRPDLFMGLREPATGMLLFGPPGTGKTMLARAVATESRSTFFSISASSLTSKYLGESEKLVRALFSLAKMLAPSIIFVDEIDSILSQRSGSGEHEATRRIKTEFLIQWSDLQRAAAGREDKDEKDGRRGDASRVLVLAATNLPWAIDEAARRRFVRRQYIPLPETETRAVQLRTLLGQQKHSLTEADIQKLVELTDGFSGSDITALAKDAAMGPLRSLGDALLMTKMDEIRGMELSDFVSSLVTIRPSVSKSGLKEYEDWAREYGERGG
ncbi:Golgi transport complex subunit 6 [Sporothrix bragantina]|uniref:Golgi transport complex subunit 6 n=1 Tax=Sporothrix bragantina TaxID=671064 RepID=A0ABP0CQD6_9PEZI